MTEGKQNDLRDLLKKYNIDQYDEKLKDYGVDCIADLNLVDYGDLDGMGFDRMRKYEFVKMMEDEIVKQWRTGHPTPSVSDGAPTDNSYMQNSVEQAGVDEEQRAFAREQYALEKERELEGFLPQEAEEDDRVTVASAFDLWKSGHEEDALSNMLRSSINPVKLEWQQWMTISRSMPSSILIAIRDPDEREQLRLLLYFSCEKKRFLEAVLSKFMLCGFDLENVGTKKQLTETIIALIAQTRGTDDSPEVFFQKMLAQKAHWREVVHDQANATEALLDAARTLVEPSQDLKEALGMIGENTVPQVVMVLTQDDVKTNVTFDFDPKTDNLLTKAKQLKDAGTMPQTLPIEDLHRNIERAIVTRCRQIASERSMSERSRGRSQPSASGWLQMRLRVASGRLCRTSWCSRRPRVVLLSQHTLGDVVTASPFVAKQLAGRLRITMRNPAGNQVGEFALDPGATVGELKEYLVRLTNADVWHQKILHEQAILMDSFRWIDTSVRENDALTLVLCKVPLQDDSINQAVKDVCGGRTARDDVDRKYGHISRWDTSNITNMSQLFENQGAFNEDLNAWNVGNVTSMLCMFSGASKFNGDLNAWNVGNVTDMGGMFQAASTFNGDLSAWNVDRVTNMSGMFWRAETFNGDLSAWNVSKVKYMREMFSEASTFNGDLSAWNVGRVTKMNSMFSSAKSFNGDLSAWNVASVTNMSSMFCGAKSFNGDLSSWNVAGKTTKGPWGGMFDECPISRNRKPKGL